MPLLDGPSLKHLPLVSKCWNPSLLCHSPHSTVKGALGVFQSVTSSFVLLQLSSQCTQLFHIVTYSFSHIRPYISWGQGPCLVYLCTPVNEHAPSWLSAKLNESMYSRGYPCPSNCLVISRSSKCWIHRGEKRIFIWGYWQRLYGELDIW